MWLTHNLGIFINSFNIFGMGVGLIWIFGSVFLSRAISETGEEWLMGFLTCLLFGLFLVFPGKLEKVIILVVAILLVIIGVFNRIGGKHNE